MNENQTGWPSAAVAIAILVLIGAVTIAAIQKYTLGEAMQIWQAMTALIGLVTGAFVTYFFTRSSIETAQTQAHEAMQLAQQESRRADAAHAMLTKAAGLVPPPQFEALLMDPSFRVAMGRIDDTNGHAGAAAVAGAAGGG
jgi:hypothetical protein